MWRGGDGDTGGRTAACFTHLAGEGTGDGNLQYSLVSIYASLAIGIVRAVTTQVYGGFFDRRFDLGDGEGRVGLEHEGDQAGHVGRGHRGTAAGGIAAAPPTGAHAHAGGGQVGLDLAGERGWSPAGEPGDGVVAIGGRHGQRFGVAGGRTDSAGSGAVVAGGKDRHDASGQEGLHIGLKLGIGAKVTAPRVVDRRRGATGVGVAAVQSGGGQDPLKSSVDVRVPAVAPIVQSFDGDPLRACRDADFVFAILPDDGAHGVRAVPMAVGRGGGVVARGVEPVIVVVKAAVLIATIARGQRRVGVENAGVYVGHHHALAGDTELFPHVVGVDVGDVPFQAAGYRCCGGCARGGRGRRLRRRGWEWRVQPLAMAVKGDPCHVVAAGDGFQGLAVHSGGQPVKDPKGAIGRHVAVGGQVLDLLQQASLGSLGRLAQGFVDLPPPLDGVGLARSGL